MKRLYFLVGVLAGVGLLAAVAMGGGGLLAPAPDLSPSSSLTPSPQPSPLKGEGGRRPGEGEGHAGPEQIGPEIGQLAPDFALTDEHKGEVTSPLLSDLRGHPVLINFWASTCPYCREEMPILQKLSERYPELVVIGVNVLEERETIEGFLWETGVSYRIVQDGWGEVSSAYRVLKIPATFLVDERGVVAWRKFGAVSEREIEEQVESFHLRVKGRSSLQQLEAAQIVLGPPGVCDHVFEGARAEGLSRTMEDNGHRATVGMAIRLMAALLTHEDESIAQQGAHEFPRRDIAQQRHTLTATVGAGLTSTSPTGSVGMGSPAWRRDST